MQKVTINTLLACILGLSLPSLSLAQPSQTNVNPNYKLVWADEFNKNGNPDTTNWKFENGFQRNHELQWYQAENASCKNGLLVIEVKKAHSKNPYYEPAGNNWKTNREYIEYTSSSLNTEHKHSWQYGRFVMRARIPVDAGLWPAFWTLGINKPWPSNGEIDIMEYYANKILANIACGTAKPYHAKWYSKTVALDSLGANWSKQFHIWRMNWDENAIALFVDDKLLNKVELKDLVNQDGSNFNPFMQPHYILLNMALGGDNGGEPTASTRFPAKYEIDYVRVYQKK